MKKIKSFFVALIGMISAIYLINPTAGIIELIPDAMPLVGNLDEAGASLLLISSLKYFGLDLSTIFKRDVEEIQEDKE